MKLRPELQGCCYARKQCVRASCARDSGRQRRAFSSCSTRMERSTDRTIQRAPGSTLLVFLTGLGPTEPLIANWGRGARWSAGQSHGSAERDDRWTDRPDPRRRSGARTGGRVQSDPERACSASGKLSIGHPRRRRSEQQLRGKYRSVALKQGTALGQLISPAGHVPSTTLQDLRHSLHPRTLPCPRRPNRSSPFHPTLQRHHS